MNKLLRTFSDEFNLKVGALLVVLTVGYGLREMSRPGEETNRENLNILELEHQLPLTNEGGHSEPLAQIKQEALRQ